VTKARHPIALLTKAFTTGRKVARVWADLQKYPKMRTMG
jgi:hypothetical protein